MITLILCAGIPPRGEPWWQLPCCDQPQSSAEILGVRKLPGLSSLDSLQCFITRGGGPVGQKKKKNIIIVTKVLDKWWVHIHNRFMIPEIKRHTNFLIYWKISWTMSKLPWQEVFSLVFSVISQNQILTKTSNYILVQAWPPLWHCLKEWNFV